MIGPAKVKIAKSAFGRYIVGKADERGSGVDWDTLDPDSIPVDSRLVTFRFRTSTRLESAMKYMQLFRFTVED